MMKREDLFASATLKLTGWYLLILMVVSLAFSFIVYEISSGELQHGLRVQERPPLTQSDVLFDPGAYGRQLRETRLAEAKERMLGSLALFNIGVLIAGGIGSYLLARRTLRPIARALEAQTRFSSDAAHELRTPLAVMQSEIEVALRDKKATKAAYRETLESNLDEVHRLRTLTDRLLLLASDEKLVLEPVQLEEVIIDALNRAVPLAQTKHIAIDNTISSTTVQANEAALTDIMTVLIDNAIKYSPRNSTITLRTVSTDKTVTIQVVDEGIGINSGEQEKIFDRFYRVDQSRNKQTVEGYGLGLSIAKRLVHEQHGRLWAGPNVAVGKGSVFSVRLRRV